MDRVLLVLAERDISDADFARSIGESSQTVHNWKARGAIPAGKVLKVARVLQLNPVWVSDGTGPRDAGVMEPAAVYEVGDREYEFVKRVKGAVLSAGPGRVNFEMEEIDQSHAFRREWLRKRGLKPERCRIMEIHGDSMDPYLTDGDVVLVNLDDRDIRDGQIYAIAVDGEAKIKRLFKLTANRVEIRSDNPSPKYRSEIIEAEQLERLNIIGRVVWRGG